MPTLTTNYSFNKPLVNNATDADLWGGQLNSNWDDLDTELKNVEDAANAAGRLPVGSIYMNASNSTNPATLLGYGTWVALGVDRVLIGHGSTYTAGGTGGSNTQTLSSSNLASHFHRSGVIASASGTGDDRYGNEGTDGTDGTGNVASSASSPFTRHRAKTSNTGSGSSFSIVQAYEVVYMWKRTA